MAIQGVVLAVADPDLPYDKRAIHFTIQPVFGPDRVSVAWRGSAIPYRVLKNGRIEQWPGDAIDFSGADAYADAVGDADIAKALGAIETALQAFVTAKGV